MNVKNNISYLKTYVTEYKLLHYVRQRGYARDMRWIKVMAKSGRLVVGTTWSEIWLDNYLKEMEQIINSLNVAYGDNWDMHINPVTIGFTRYELQPILLYPDTDVKNSGGNSINIKNLIVSFNLIKNNDFAYFTFAIEELIGTRFNYEYVQFTAGYVHSHLHTKYQSNSANNFDMGSFCTGGDAEIDDIMSEIYGNGFEEGMFGLFLTMIDVLVAWESLEGIPYVNMSSIVDPITTYKINSYSPVNLHYITLKNDLRNGLECNFVYNSGKYMVKNDQTINDSVREIIIAENNAFLYKNLLVKKNGNDYYGYMLPIYIDIQRLLEQASYSIMIDGEVTYELPYVFIQGRKIELEIQSFQREEVNINEYNVYPKFLEYVIQQVESELYEKAIRHSTIERINQHNNV